jgi:hypothetical protein
MSVEDSLAGWDVVKIALAQAAARTELRCTDSARWYQGNTFSPSERKVLDRRLGRAQRIMRFCT